MISSLHRSMSTSPPPANRAVKSNCVACDHGHCMVAECRLVTPSGAVDFVDAIVDPGSLSERRDPRSWLAQHTNGSVSALRPNRRKFARPAIHARMDVSTRPSPSPPPLKDSSRLTPVMTNDARVRAVEDFGEPCWTGSRPRLLAMPSMRKSVGCRPILRRNSLCSTRQRERSPTHPLLPFRHRIR